MRLVEQHVIGKKDARYTLIDAACFASKNLYNYANYIVRQSFIHKGVYKGYAVVYYEVKHADAYKALPAKVANDVLQLLNTTVDRLLSVQTMEQARQVLIANNTFDSTSS